MNVWGPPLALFGVALLLRLWFFQGFVLGDDRGEVWVLQRVAAEGVKVRNHLRCRFMGWLLNVVAVKLFGLSEWSFFLPTIVLSSSFGMIAYAMLKGWGFRKGEAWLGGLVVATAPFEVMIGTLRAIDVIMAWLLALGWLALVRWERRPVAQGMALGGLLWLAFYARPAALYVLPALVGYYALRVRRAREWRGVGACVATSVILHGATMVYWFHELGTPFPFSSSDPTLVPLTLAPHALPFILMAHPRQLFVGSEVGTTLFGAVPALVVVLLGVKWFAAIARGRRTIDQRDVALSAYVICWFLLLNFMPNVVHFTLRRYETFQRIFRYLTPLSFPMTLHLAKLLIEAIQRWRSSNSRLAWAGGMVWLVLIDMNVCHAEEATRPGRLYRRNLVNIVQEIERHCPQQVVADSWLAFFLREVYLRSACGGQIAVVNPPEAVDSAAMHERWLVDHEADFPDGTWLITGLGSYVHYGCHGCGFRVRQFAHPLHPRWELIREYDELTYLPVPEPARLWWLVKPVDGRSVATP